MSGNALLKGRTILIAGGSRGIGLAMVRRCLAEGATVYCIARTKADLDSAFADYQNSDLSKQGVMHVLDCDIANEEQVSQIFDFIGERDSQLDGLVCCAATIGTVGRFLDLPLTLWAECYDTNVIGTLRCIQHASVLMKKDKRSSRKIVLLGGALHGPQIGRAAYAASKAAINQITETLASELRDEGIFLNSILPGPVNTKIFEKILAGGPEAVGAEEHNLSLRRLREGGTSPEKAADLCAYLLSDHSGTLYGRSISARFDDYWALQDFDALSKSDRFTFRRVKE